MITSGSIKTILNLSSSLVVLTCVLALCGINACNEDSDTSETPPSDTENVASSGTGREQDTPEGGDTTQSSDKGNATSLPDGSDTTQSSEKSAVTTSSSIKPICQELGSICSVAPSSWAGEIFTKDKKARILQGQTHATFATWLQANPKFQTSMCKGSSDPTSPMRKCCLILDAECPIPYNNKLITVAKGERLTFRLPPSPCDKTDKVPLSGFARVTAETTRAHQVGICRDKDGQYGCIHIDGISEGPASVMVVAYYDKKQGECSAEAALSDSTAKGFTQAFGASLDAKFNNGKNITDACCLNTVMFSVQVVPQTFSNIPVALDKKAIIGSKSHMIKGGVQMCNVSLQVCQSLQTPLRKVIAKHISANTQPTQVWLDCANMPRLGSNKPGGIVIGGCSDNVFLNYEVYMDTQPLIGFMSATTSLQKLLNRNNGSQNPTGNINGSTPYNYVFVNDLQNEINKSNHEAKINQAKMSLSDYQVYTNYQGSVSKVNSKWKKYHMKSGAEDIGSFKGFEALAGRTSVLSTSIKACESKDYSCLALAKHNEYRASAGLKPMIWDSALEVAATKYANDLCGRSKIEHSTYAAENIYEAIPNEGEKSVSKDAEGRGIQMVRATQSWFLESNWYNYSRVGSSCQTDYLYTAKEGTNSYSNFYKMQAEEGSNVYNGGFSSLIPAGKRMTGHFTLMMQSTGSKVGCGACTQGEEGRWIVVCHYDKSNSTGTFPFSPRAAAAIVQNQETADPADDTVLSSIPCDGAMTNAERVALEAIDAKVTLNPAPSGYTTIPAKNSFYTELFPDEIEIK
jgi:uncharacterized protein YkwD